MTIAPCLIQSVLINLGIPTAPTIRSAFLIMVSIFCVLEWHIVTVAFKFSSIMAIGLPNIGLLPTTTAFKPCTSSS